LEYNIPITDTTAFHIASVSKQFTVFAALLLESRGKLSMDDDIKKYLPELKSIPYTITVKQLANHTHGFANTFELAQLVGISPDEVMTHSRMMKILLRQKQLNFEPGTQFQYNNSGFTLLAEIVARVSGMSFAEFAQKEIFDPLQMKHTIVFDNNTTIVPNKAYSYRKTKKGFEKLPYNYTVIGGSGINTTLNDLSLWALNFENPKIGNPEIFEKMKKPSRLKNGTQIPYGLGLETKHYKGMEVVFHGGGDAGYRSYIMRIPQQDFAVVLLGNLESFNPLDLAYRFADLYLKEALITPKQETIPHYTTAELQKWEGDYEVFPGSFFTLKAKNDSLFIQPFREKQMFPLPVAGTGTFTYPYAAHSKLVFNKDGLKWHFSDFAYPCTKVTVSIPESVRLEDYTGVFWNEELNTTYRIAIKGDKLVVTHALNEAITLNPLEKDAFYANAGFFGRATFVRNSKQKVISFQLSGQNLNKITFIKLK
jgi:CubicO group peptidase (beta-lactamase class C family)